MCFFVKFADAHELGIALGEFVRYQARLLQAGYHPVGHQHGSLGDRGNKYSDERSIGKGSYTDKMRKIFNLTSQTNLRQNIFCIA